MNPVIDAPQSQVGAAHLPIQRLGSRDRAAITQHLLALGSTDRHLRFGAMLSDLGIASYVERIAFGRDAVFGVRDAKLRLLGMAHVAFDQSGAELGLSVTPDARRRGIGSALLGRATAHARSRGAERLVVHCLTENAVMMHLARRAGMQVRGAAGESDGALLLPRPDAEVLAGELVSDQLGWYDFGLKSQAALWAQFAGPWSGAVAIADAPPHAA
ncbi:MAG: GNAT family N-acetyltransferase [Casimicrobiaceae bacterium]